MNTSGIGRAAALALTALAMLAGCGGGNGSKERDGSQQGEDKVVHVGSDGPDSPGSTSPQPTTPVDWPPPAQLSPPTSCSAARAGTHATYDVGPGRPYTELTDVPWLSLQAGDVVNIHYRATPYRTKFGLRAQGTPDAPVVINGVTDSECRRPEITGDGAVTARDVAAAGFGAGIEALGLIQIWRSPADNSETHVARHIEIRNLRLTGARHDRTFTGPDGQQHAYDYFSAAIYAVRVQHLTVENCEITGNGLGVFTNSRGYSPEDYSAYLYLRRNKVYDNGNPGRSTEHNFYTQARRVLYEGNEIGRAAGGSSLKDRSSGTVIRYNRITAGARAIDLVESEEEVHKNLSSDPLYPHAWVYGNVIINDSSGGQGFSVRAIHWGFDNNAAQARTGTLFFYGNTFVNKVDQAHFWYVNVFQIGNESLPSVAPRIEAWSNVFWQQGTSEFRFLADVGRLTLRGANYLPVGWVTSAPGNPAVVETAGFVLLTGLSPGLDAGFAPLPGAAVLDRGAVDASFTPAGVNPQNLLLTGQYAQGRGVVARPVAGLLDLGAIERP